MADALASIVTLLTDNWNDSNTGSNTPVIDKITSYKKIDFNKNKDWVLIQRGQNTPSPAGVGASRKNVIHTISIDIRTSQPGSAGESHWQDVIAEVRRILGANIVNPDANFNEIIPDVREQDLSDKTRDLWRIIIDIKLRELNKAR